MKLILLISHLILTLSVRGIADDAKPAQRSVVTDEPLQIVGKPEGSAFPGALLVAWNRRRDSGHRAGVGVV